MSPMSPTVRRTLWTAGALVAIVAGLIVWFIGPGNDGRVQERTDPPADAAAVAGSPDSAPSSGPTSTPEPGSLEVVPVEEATTAPAVPLTATADFGTGMKLRIMRIESVQGVARGPGEVAGPAVRLTLRMSNGSDSAVSLESAVVDVSTGSDHTPAPSLTGPGGKRFEGEVPPGGSMTAVYVFAVPEDERERLQVAVSYLAAEPVVVFAGAAE